MSLNLGLSFSLIDCHTKVILLYIKLYRHPHLAILLIRINTYTCIQRERALVAYVLDCDIVVSDISLQSRYYVPFQTNTLGKCMNTLIPQQYVW